MQAVDWPRPLTNYIQAAAGQSFEGLRQGTRAGLEYALERHKVGLLRCAYLCHIPDDLLLLQTMDVQIDMDAPIIIVPER